MKNKLNVGLIFGGRSVEHEISVKSAKNVYDAINKDKYDITLIGISKDGKWLLNPTIDENGVVTGDIQLAIVPGIKQHQLYDISQNNQIKSLDIIFPILHGTYGEDGTMQGLLKLMNIPFVGSGILGSALGMDKEIMKRLLKDSQIPSAEYIVLYKYNQNKNLSYAEVKQRLGTPFFVKPACLGSSVGVSKVNSEQEFLDAIENGFQFDEKILIERFIKGREIECSVLGNENPIASIPGEIISNHEFYSYEAKYLDENGARLEIPAKLSEDVISKIKNLSIETYKSLYLEGLSRIDFFVTENNDVLVNEVNTMPGFTKISMYPKLWEQDGISYPNLIDKLIQLGIEKYQKEAELKTSI